MERKIVLGLILIGIITVSAISIYMLNDSQEVLTEEQTMKLFIKENDDTLKSYEKKRLEEEVNFDELIIFYDNETINYTTFNLKKEETDLIEQLSNLTSLARFHTSNFENDRINLYVAYQTLCSESTSDLIKELKLKSKDGNYSKEIEKDQIKNCKRLEILAGEYINKYEKNK